MLIFPVAIPLEEKLGDFFAYGSQPNSLGRLVSNSIGVFLVFAVILSLLFLLIGGISWITSGGDKSQLETARNRIIHALTGLIITVAIWAVWVLVVKNFLGIDITGGVDLKNSL